MRHPTASTIKIATALVLVAWILPINPAGSAPAPSQVQVVNTQPVPVAGTVVVSELPPVTGTVTVSSLPLVSGTVGIDPAANTVQTAAVVTDVILNEFFTRQDDGDAATFALSGVDVSSARQVRLSVTCQSLFSASCADIVVQVYGDSGGPLYALDRYTLGDNSATRLYEVPGTGFWVTISNVGVETLLSVSLIGRAN